MKSIKELIGEATDYDKKQALEKKKPKSWCKSVSAFANTLGGSLIFGVANDDSLVGLPDAEGDAEEISEAIKFRISPIPEFKLRFEVIDDMKFVILDVYAGKDTPYYYAADGTTEAFIRVGNESVPANSAELKRLVLRGMNETYDTQNSGCKISDYAFSKLRERYKKITGVSFENKDFLSFGMVDENGILNNAGALLADESPIRYSRVFCTRWNGLNKAGGSVDAYDSAEYTGSIISLLNDSVAFIKRNTKIRWKKLPLSRVDMPEYIERGYFEALVNALIHRDYLETGSEVHVDIFDDRLEIYSPGGMVDGNFIQNMNLDDVPSKRRNPLLADIFARLDYMERKGSGIGKIIASYENAANYSEDKTPVFYSDRTQFKVIFPNLNFGVDENDYENNQDKVYDRVQDEVYDEMHDEIYDTNHMIGSVTLKEMLEFCKTPKTKKELLKFCGLKSGNSFSRVHLKILMDKGVLKMTIPDKPKSKNQKYYYCEK